MSRPEHSSTRLDPRLAAAAATALLACLAVLLSPATGSGADAPPRSFYGVVPQDTLTDKDFDQMQRDRVGMVRQLFHWPWIEPRPGEFNWGYIDATMSKAAAAGIEVWPVLYGTPRWAQSAKQRRRCGETCAPNTPEARRSFAQFAAAAVARYGPNGSFWGGSGGGGGGGGGLPENPCQVPPLLCRGSADVPARTWQVWNEQNSPKYHGPKVSVDGYAQLLRETATAIRGASPGVEVALGGMWGPPDTNAVLPTLDYLKKLYKIDGIEGSFESIAVHPYASSFRKVASQVRGVRKLVEREGDGGVGLWVTELGWASGGPKSQPLVKNPRAQSRLLKRSYKLLIRHRTDWNIRGVHWYAWRDTGGKFGICKWCPKSGLRTKRGGAKPAAKAYRKLPRAG